MLPAGLQSVAPRDEILVVDRNVEEKRLGRLVQADPPGQRDRRVDNHVAGDYIDRVIRVAEHRSYDPLTRADHQAGWPVQIVHPAGQRFPQRCHHWQTFQTDRVIHTATTFDRTGEPKIDDVISKREGLPLLLPIDGRTTPVGRSQFDTTSSQSALL